MKDKYIIADINEIKQKCRAIKIPSIASLARGPAIIAPPPNLNRSRMDDVDALEDFPGTAADTDFDDSGICSNTT